MSICENLGYLTYLDRINALRKQTVVTGVIRTVNQDTPYGITMNMVILPFRTPLFSLNSKMLVHEFTSHTLIVFSLRELETTTSLYIGRRGNDFGKEEMFVTKRICKKQGKLIHGSTIIYSITNYILSLLYAHYRLK